MWIKICGNTTLEDAALAVTHGADAVGFVFAKSPRQVTPEAVGEITRQLPESIEKYGVFVDADLDRIVETVHIAGLTGVQLHATDLAHQLRKHFTNGVKGTRRLSILQVLHFDANAENFAMQLHALGRQAGPGTFDAVLIDSRTATQPGGTGIAFDWEAARESFTREEKHLRLIAAGGLQPENVAEAIATLQPWGVDVASGVEARPGKKDPQRVAAFIQAARMAGNVTCASTSKR